MAPLGLRVRGDAGVATLVSEDLPAASVDLRTGVVSAPAEWAPLLGKLRMQYSEAKFREEAAREGVEIRSRTVQKDGSVLLKCRIPARD